MTRNAIWPVRNAVRLRALTAVAWVAAVGCGRDHDIIAEDGAVAPELAALMADGALPSGMTAPPMGPTLPPRFCGGSSGFPDQDGGVSMPPPIGGRGGPIPIPVGVANASAGPVPPSGPVVVVGSAGRGEGAGGSASTPPQGVDPSCASVPIGFWRFDDCNTARTDLSDSSFQGHTAFRSVELSCTAGQEGQAVAFENRDDLVYAPDQPDFALDAGVTVAAWVKPDAVDRVRTLFRKRDDADSAFALVINDHKFQFVVKLASGRLVSVSTPAKAGQWTHVAASYDGMLLRLYIDGAEASRARARGVIARGVGPLLMGNDGAGRRFSGLMDNAWFNTLAAPDTIIQQLTCIHHDPTVTVSPLVSDAVAAGSAVTFTLSITNANAAVCAPESYLEFVNTPSEEFTAVPSFNFGPELASGESTQLPIVVSSGSETEAGSYSLGFVVETQGRSFSPTVAPPSGVGSSPPIAAVASGFVQVTAQYVVAEPSGCHVNSQRELMIRDLSVVEDPVRTALDGRADNPSTGAWTFGRLMQRLAPSAADAPDVTEAMLRTFLTPQTVNTFSIPERTPMLDQVLTPWPRTADGKLDLARAPVLLLAITNRLDLVDLAHGKAGEGRMVFGVVDSFGNPMQFTIIFEYLLPAQSDAEVRSWTDPVHALQALPFPSESYNQALQALTDRFSARGALPDHPNGNALIDIRTNELSLALDGQWQLREFHISPTTGFMEPATVAQTPDAAFNGSDRLARFINQNEAVILTERHEAPLSFEDAPFQAAFVFNNIDTWDAPGIVNPEARHKFSLNTCNGCHGGETQTGFLHVNPRFPGQVSSLSRFLTGETVVDIRGVERRLSELLRRRQLLESVVCADAP